MGFTLQINLLLKLNKKLQDEILNVLKDKLTYDNDFLEKNKLKQIIQNLQLKRIKNKFFRSKYINSEIATLPLELFDNIFEWQPVVSALYRILGKEIRSKHIDHDNKKRLIEHIGKIDGFNSIVSDHAFIITKEKETPELSELVSKMRNYS